MTSDLKDKGIIKSGVHVGYFPKGIFASATSQVGTSQMFNFPSSNFLKVMLGPLRRRRLQRG